MATLAELRQKLQALETKSQRSSDNAYFPFWDQPLNSTSTVRFLPDANENNTFFWVEKQQIKLTFPGVVGDADKKPITIKVPCVEMYGEKCPIMTEIRPWFKTEMEDLARKYWKKRSYLFQGFVRNSQVSDTAPANPIRLFQISSQLFTIIKSAIMDPDMENLPVDYDNGTDFQITKTQKGQFADYSTSKWARKESALSQEERDAIATHKLHDLSSMLPKKPSADELEQIFEMFEASIAGELFDPQRWGSFYKGGNKASEAPATVAVSVAPPVQATDDNIDFDGPAVEPAAAVEAEPELASASPAKNMSAADIIAAIRRKGA